MGDPVDWKNLSEKDLPLLIEAFKAVDGRSASPWQPVGMSEERLRLVFKDMIAPLEERVREIQSASVHFVPEEKIDHKIADRFRSIGLNVDPEHIEETGETVRSAMKWQKRIDKVIAGIVLSIMSALIYAFAQMLGLKLPSPGGSG